MRIRFIALAAVLLLGLGACAGGFSPGAPATSTYSNGGGAGGGGGY